MARNSLPRTPHLLAPLALAASITALATGCASTSAASAEPATPETEAAAAPAPAQATAPEASPAPAASEAEKPAAAAPAAGPTSQTPRKLGDFHVYQYAGTFSKEPVTLTEQVVAREGELLVVDFVLQEGNAMSALRVRMKPTGEVASVFRILDDGEVAATVAEYEALIQRTALVPDSNDRVLSSEKTSCLVGDEAVDCEVTTYQVTIGDRAAKLTITRSAKLPGRDLGGDVVTEDGTVLYSARLIERGNEPPVVEALARMDRFTPDGP